MNPATHAICIMANCQPTHQPAPTTRVCLRYPVGMEFIFQMDLKVLRITSKVEQEKRD